REVQKELADGNAIVGEIPFEVANIPEPLVPDLLGDQLLRYLLLVQKLRVYANYQSLFVVAAIEYSNAAAFGKALQTSPQIIVIKIFACRRLERIDLAALRVDAGHDVLDRTIFSGGVHRLKDEQNCPTVLRVKHVLQFGEGFDAGCQRFLCARFVLSR